jgi:small nuclear ribonucleoprotein B and B'
MVQAKRTKLMGFINYRVRLVVSDGRHFIGRFMAFDRHLNLVISDCEEFRKISNKTQNQREERRVLGLAIIRGDEVVSLSIVAPPPADTVRTKLQSAPPGTGVSQTVSRGIPGSLSQLPIEQTGFVKGLGGLTPGSMQPRPYISGAIQNSSGAKPLPGSSSPGSPLPIIPSTTSHPGLIYPGMPNQVTSCPRKS